MDTNSPAQQPAEGTAETAEVALTLDEVCRTGFVLHTHDTVGGHILCLGSCDCGKPSLLPILFQDGATVTLNLQVPPAEDPRGVDDAHPRIDVHLNPGDDAVHHDPCLTFDACGPCLSEAWESIFRSGGGRIGVHHDQQDPDSVLVAPFRIGNWRETRQAVATAQARLIRD